MADQWYYGAEGSRQGPFSDRQLRTLAAEGSIRPTDTIWKEGVATGMPAHRVKNLFPPGVALPDANVPVPSPAAAAEAGSEAAPTAAPPAAPEQADDQVPEDQPAPKPPKPPKPTRKGRAVALKGAIIVSQDGEIVIYTRKCTVCGHQETGRSRMPIRPGVTRASYFCPKCKKARPIEMQGV